MNTKIALMVAGLIAFTVALILLVLYDPNTAPVVLSIALLMFIFGIKKIRKN